jgi:hypothetical protein
VTQFSGHVAVLGSGIVGAAVAVALMDAGRPVRAWGAGPSWFLAVLADAGAATTSPLDAVHGADVVVLAPSAPTEGTAIEAALAGHLPPTVLIVRGPADDAAPLATWLSREHVGHLECVVLGRPIALGTRSAVVLVSGPAAAVAEHRGTLDALGTTIVVDGTADSGRRSEIALLGLWYDVNVAVLRALANIDPSVRPVVEIELRAVLAQLPATIDSIDHGSDVQEDLGLGLHARLLETVNACRRAAGRTGTELEEAARCVDALLSSDDPRSPLARIAESLRCPVDGVANPGPTTEE